MAASGASTRGPFFSSRTSGERAGRPSTTAVSRRGVAKVFMSLNSSPASPSALPEEAREVLARAGLHPRRDLLGEQFKQKLSHRRRPPRS